MRQVPYAVVGSGRVARHFCHDFQLCDIAHLQWSRQLNPNHEKLAIVLERAECVLLLISGGQINTNFHVDYIAELHGRRLGAGWLDSVRLIDNIEV